VAVHNGIAEADSENALSGHGSVWDYERPGAENVGDFGEREKPFSVEESEKGDIEAERKWLTIMSYM